MLPINYSLAYIPRMRVRPNDSKHILHDSERPKQCDGVRSGPALKDLFWGKCPLEVTQCLARSSVIELRHRVHTCQPCHFILLDTLFIFAGHQTKLQDTNTTYYVYTKLSCSCTRMRTRVGTLARCCCSLSGD